MQILKRGLQPRMERDSGFHYEGESKKVRAVALTTNFKTASAYASRKSCMYGGIPIVISLDYPQNELEKSYETKTKEDAFVSLKKILPKYITGFKIVKLISGEDAAKKLGLTHEYI